jgi:Na+-transporting methylmalonyl-CoA/oxaloacetate decarboxylase gamma subunit
MFLSELVQLAVEEIVLAFLILLAQLIEQIHKVLTPELREEIGPHVTHAPDALHVLPWRLFI